jgi:PilZ domain
MHSNRKHKRKEVCYPAWLFVDGTEPRPCIIEDASVGGAQLLINNSEIVPDRFKLGFSRSANSYRNCVVRWKRDGRIGVRFYNDVAPDPTSAKVV